MFIPKSRQKRSFDLDFNSREKMLERIKSTWAEVFMRVIMPLLEKAEEDFADLYCKDNGAPNTPVALLLGVLILKEIFDLTDEEALEHLEYNLLWQYALDIHFEDAHVCRKTLHNFRVKLLQSGWHRELFNRLTKQIIALFGLKIGRQRLDSTHIAGNMKVVGRLGLFVQTIEQFLFKLKRMAQKNPEIAEYLKKLPERFHKRYLEREGYFGDTRSSQAARKLQSCAQDIWVLLQLFENEPKVSNLKQFKTLKRLFKEQCTVDDADNGKPKIQAMLPELNEAESDCVAKRDESEQNPKNAGETEQACEQNPVAKQSVAWQNTQTEQACEQTQKNSGQNEPLTIEPAIEIKKKEEIASDSLQSPADPDATYGHKGKGYEYQVSETCDSKNPFQVITETGLNGANESDQTQTVAMIEKLEKSELKPEQLHVDAGYVSGKNIIEAEDKGTELIGPLPGKAPDPQKTSLADFKFNEKGTRIEQCPNQKVPLGHGNLEEKHAYYAIFSQEDCSACPFYADCPVKGNQKRRIEWDRAKLAIARRHREVHTREFKERHKIRSGIEATNSELKNKHGAGKLRVRGYARIDFVMIFKSLAVNIKRMVLYVLAQLKRIGTDGTKNLIMSIIRIFAALWLVFSAFARRKRRKTSCALKGTDVEENCLPGGKPPGFIPKPLRG